MVVVAQYDCNPDHRDELGFSEGENLVVTKKLNKDWWVSLPLPTTWLPWIHVKAAVFPSSVATWRATQLERGYSQLIMCRRSLGSRLTTSTYIDCL